MNAESTVLAYKYASVQPTWDFSIVMPPILQALRLIPPNGRVLDIGCGNGALLAELSKRGSWALHGAEASQSGVELTRNRGFAVQFADASVDLVSLFGQQSFDLIISVEVIEHVYDPRGFLRQARSLIRTPGRLVLTTPYHGYWKNLMIALLGKGDAHYDPLLDGGHIKFWSRRTLSAALMETGFRDIQFYGAGRYPYLWKHMVLTATPC